MLKSWVVLLALLSSSLALAATVVRGPYLQSASSDSITVRWRTDTATDSRVQYGTSAKQPDLPRNECHGHHGTHRQTDRPQPEHQVFLQRGLQQRRAGLS
ncbi:hypothetical protein LP420_22025 [Massilia sp. B-10]|nr:hypothetical protein LP420_22025 [Massilia sp. B-10]